MRPYVLVLAADHLISDDAAFEEAVGQAAEQAQAGNLVVFGIRPTAPETGYGYLEVAAAGDALQPLKSFVEKPDRATAEQYLSLRSAIIGTQACSVYRRRDGRKYRNTCEGCLGGV